MSNIILKSAYDELNDYLVIHKTNPNVVRGLVDMVVAEAVAGWAVTGVNVVALTDLPYDKAMGVQLQATVYGTGEYSQNVTWAITGNVVAETTISATGLLTLAAGEFLTGETPVVEHDITVTATSVDNNGVSGTHTVTCVTPSVSLTYDANGGTGEQVDALSPYTKGVTVTTAVGTTFLAPAGKAFDRWVWDKVNPGASPDATFEITANTVIYALWKNIYTVEYDANGGTGTMTDGNTYEDGAEVVVAANTFTPPTDATFIKWNTAANGSGTDYAPAATFDIDEDTTLYAIWQYAVVEGTLVAGTQLYIEAFTSENATFISDLGDDASITFTFTEYDIMNLEAVVPGGTTFDLEVAYPVVAGLYLINAPLTTGDSFVITLPDKFTNLIITVRNDDSVVFDGVMNIAFLGIKNQGV